MIHCARDCLACGDKMDIPKTALRCMLSHESFLLALLSRTQLTRGHTLDSLALSLVEDAAQHPGKDCHAYAFGSQGPVADEVGNGYAGYVEVQEPREGDLALYYKRTRRVRNFFDPSMEEVELALKHSGVCLGNKMVRSKWGQGHVFEHPVDLVPVIYGDEVMFFRRVQAGASQ